MRIRAALTVAAVATAAAPLAAACVPAAAAGASLEGVPRVEHVVTLVLENESFSTTWSPTSPAAYLNSLVPQGAFLPDYYGTGHVSLDNYVAMTSGLAGPQVANTYTDCLGINLYTCVQEVSTAATAGNGSTPSIADQIENAGLTWKQYADGSTRPCVHDDYSPAATGSGIPPGDSYQGNGGTPTNNGAGPDYADRHVPFLYYSNIIGDAACCDAHLRPYTELGADLAANTLPAYSFITPDTCHDGHDTPCSGGGPGGLASADLFLRANLAPLLAYLRTHDGVLFVTFDEGTPSDTSGCCTGGPAGAGGFGGRVGMLVLGAPVLAHATVATAYDHASLLRTTEDMLGISAHLGNAATASPITGIWAPPAAGSTVSTSTSTSPGAGATPSAIATPNTSAPAATLTLLAPATLLAGAAVSRRRRRR